MNTQGTLVSSWLSSLRRQVDCAARFLPRVNSQIELPLLLTSVEKSTMAYQSTRTHSANSGTLLFA